MILVTTEIVCGSEVTLARQRLLPRTVLIIGLSDSYRTKCVEA